MEAFRLILIGLALLIIAGAATAHILYRMDMTRAAKAWSMLALANEPTEERFDPSAIAHLPEPARRYLGHAIAAGTPIKSVVELEMTGIFGLGDKASHRDMPFSARQILAPPSGFVWMPDIGSGAMRIWGSDGYVERHAWTRFWLLGAVPIVRRSGGTDMARSAAARSIMEAIWAPGSLLPRMGAQWQAVGEEAAEVTFKIEGEPFSMTLTLSPEGRPLTIRMLRWSDANPDKEFRFQPFGGELSDWRSFEGYTIPCHIEVGNHYGTSDYFPFFRADIRHVRFR